MREVFVGRSRDFLALTKPRVILMVLVRRLLFASLLYLPTLLILMTLDKA